MALLWAQRDVLAAIPTDKKGKVADTHTSATLPFLPFLSVWVSTAAAGPGKKAFTRKRSGAFGLRGQELKTPTHKTTTQGKCTPRSYCTEY